jgi:hypothetical protein
VLGEFFTRKPRKADPVQRRVEREALGVYAPHVTHKLVPVDPEVRLQAITIQGDARNCSSGVRCESRWYRWRTPPQRSHPDSLGSMNDPGIASFDFSQRVVFNDVELSPLTDQDFTGGTLERQRYGTARAHQPLIVARTSKQIIDDHSGIFTEPFLRFLVPYIAFIELKSYANIAANRGQRQEQSTAPDPPAGQPQ